MADIDVGLSLFYSYSSIIWTQEARRYVPTLSCGSSCPRYCKNIESMATRLAPERNDRLHQFISDIMWDEEPLRLELACQADRMVAADDAFFVIDEMALPKKGECSVGVAPRYALMMGKRASCQTLVSADTASRGRSRAGGLATVPA